MSDTHGLRDDNVCALSCHEAESVDHLLSQCVFSWEVWFLAFGCIGCQHLTSGAEDSFALWWVQERKQVPKARRRAFDSFVVLVVWGLWRERNARVSDAKCTRPDRLVELIGAQVELWCKARIMSRSQLFTM
jgi:hypothetical protein